MTVLRSAHALLLVLALSACGLSRPEVARVGDRDVEDADLRHAVALQQALADLQGVPCGGEGVAGEGEGAACNRAALSGELLWLAVVGYAEANGIAPAAAGPEEAVSQLEAQFGAEAVNQALEAHDVTRDDLLELGRRILTLRAVRTAVAEDRVEISELRAQYEQRALEFTIVQVNHILVETAAEAANTTSASGATIHRPTGRERASIGGGAFDREKRTDEGERTVSSLTRTGHSGR
jgi:stage V sporulation protein SpoVS